MLTTTQREASSRDPFGEPESLLQLAHLSVKERLLLATTRAGEADW